MGGWAEIRNRVPNRVRLHHQIDQAFPHDFSRETLKNTGRPGYEASTQYRTYCNLGARKNNSNIIWRLNISFKNSLRPRLALRCRSEVERSPTQCLGHDFFVEFRSVVRGYLALQEFEHLYWMSNCPPSLVPRPLPTREGGAWGRGYCPPCSVCALQQYTTYLLKALCHDIRAIFSKLMSHVT